MTIRSNLLFLILFIIFSASKAQKDVNCLEKSSDAQCRLTTMTPYRFIANHDDTEIKFQGCQARKLWLIVRHGTRRPSAKVIKQMIHQLPQVRQAILDNCRVKQCFLTDDLRRRLDQWQASMTENEEKLLTTEGEDELIGLGERFQARFPSLLPEEYSNNTYKFKTTPTQRSRESAKFFSVGLFGKKQSNHVHLIEVTNSDPVLRFYKGCKRWQKDVNHNPEAYREVERFINSSTVLQILENLSNRLGLNINYDTAEIIRLTCSYETAWNRTKRSPWCELFSPFELEVLEYAHDLEYYWIDGYGYPLTYEQACPSLRDMFDAFRGESGTKTTAYFTHSGALLKVMSLLGIAKDSQPLLHSTFDMSRNHCVEKKIFLYIRNGVDFVDYNTLINSESFNLSRFGIPEQCFDKCGLYESDFDALRNWQPEDIDLDSIVQSYKHEIFELARRFIWRFPWLMTFPDQLDDKIKFLYEDDERYEKSAEKFVSTIFELYYYIPPSPSAEEILVQKFHTVCKKHDFDVKQNLTNETVIREFEESIFMTITKGWINYLFGTRLSYEQILTLRMMCAIQTLKATINVTKNAEFPDKKFFVTELCHGHSETWYFPKPEKTEFDWCQVFKSNGLNVVEFFEDMKAWYKDGYGHEINSARACVVLKNMFNMLTNDSVDLCVLGYLNVAPEAMFSVLTALGIGFEEELRADTFSRLFDRNWQQSKINGLLSNLAFIRYDCGGRAKFPGPGIVTMHQERIVDLKGCPKNVPCPVETFEKLFPVTSDKCNFDKLCSVDDNYYDNEYADVDCDDNDDNSADDIY